MLSYMKAMSDYEMLRESTAQVQYFNHLGLLNEHILCIVVDLQEFTDLLAIQQITPLTHCLYVCSKLMPSLVELFLVPHG